MPDLIEGLNILPELFSTQDFSTNLLDGPKAIRRLMDELDNLYFEAYDELAEVIRSLEGHIPFMAFNARGPGAIHHMDSVLTIPELNTVQWEPGAGNPHTGTNSLNR